MARPKGSKNKQTSQKAFKEQLEWAFDKVNVDGAYLIGLAANEPKAFAGLLSKLMPSAHVIDTNVHIDLGTALIDAGNRLQAMQPAQDITPNTLIIDNDSETGDSETGDK